MRAKTFATILLVFAAVWWVVSTIRLNAGLVTVRLPFTSPIQLELWMVLLAGFGVGAGIILLFDIAGGARRFARDRRRKKARRASAEIEDLYLHGLESLMNGHYQRAADRFDRVLDREPMHTNAMIKKGDCLRALKRFRPAAELLERATRMDSDNLLGLYSLSDVYLEAGADERAKATLERIIELDPETTVSAHRKLRDLLVRQLEWQEASEVQEKLLGMITSAEERELELVIAKGIRLGLGVSLLKKGEIEQATGLFKDLISQDERFVPAYIRLGEAYAAMDDAENAIRTWRKGFEVTGSTEPLSMLQNFYLRDEQPEEAIGVWKQAILLSENEVPLRYCLGKLYYRLFMLDEALREFQMCEDRVSGLPSLHLYIARILESQGKISAALAKTKMLVAEVEGLMMDYVCGACEWRTSEWTERCPRCRRWDTVSLFLPVVQAPEPTIQPAPTWSIP
jgi:lipopolysaccharide biosynthesis regulator YciM